MRQLPTFFEHPEAFRAWLAEHHADREELIVGFYKRGSGKSGMTWKQAVPEALCFGWIDGVGRRIDAATYSVRFTPRQPRSTWSLVNIKLANELIADGRMQPAGLAAFEARSEKRSGIYSHEQAVPPQLDDEQEARLRAVPEAWEWWCSRPPSYRRQAAHWVTSAKKAETRERRLEALIAECAAGRAVKPLRRP